MNASLRNKLSNVIASDPSSPIRRCRPLLGTFVEIFTRHDDPRQAQAAVEAAFAAIDRVQRRMSFHDEQSDVARLNRRAFCEPVGVSDETCEVLRAAKELYEFTGGLFDIAIAPELLRHGLLPQHRFLNSRKTYIGRTCDLELRPAGQVRFLKPLCIDLGGIAKGFAVDQAIEVLKGKGMDNGIVNAGGDIRCFGKEAQPIWVRNPAKAGTLLPLLALKNAALATSSNFAQGNGVSHIHGKTRETLWRPFSVSVVAESCLLADALTKVALTLGEDSGEMLAQLNATVFIVYPDNKIKCCESSAG